MDLTRGPAGVFVAGFLLSAIVAGCTPEEPADDGRVFVRFAGMAGSESGDPEAVEVVGLGRSTLRDLDRVRRSPSEWAALFPVWVGQEAPEQGEERPTLLGSYSLRQGVVRFEPRFPFAAGETYHAVWRDLDSLQEVARRSLRLPPAAASEMARVTAIYPSASELPENLLRFYVHFSTPMSREHAGRQIRLIGPDGPLERPFVAIEHELWNPTRDRLTLILDPGRVKRGVGPNLAEGPVLSRDAEFRLEIGAGWPDGAGGQLGESFSKVFRVVEPDREAPKPDAWELVPPSSAGQTLTLSFPEPLDHGLLLSAIRVEQGSGQRIAGLASIGAEELSWVFEPQGEWPAGPLRIVVDPALEDPSGNSVRRVFDNPQHNEVGSGERREPVVLEFAVQTPPTRGG